MIFTITAADLYNNRVISAFYLSRLMRLLLHELGASILELQDI